MSTRQQLEQHGQGQVIGSIRNLHTGQTLDWGDLADRDLLSKVVEQLAELPGFKYGTDWEFGYVVDDDGYIFVLGSGLTAMFYGKQAVTKLMEWARA